MKPVTVYQALAQALQARENCQRSGNDEWFARHTETIEMIAREYLPGGSGIDSGTRVDVDRSTPDRIRLELGYHHMNDGGMYDGWTEHTITIRPSLAFGFTLQISGKDRNGIKEYLSDTYHYAIGQVIRETRSEVPA
jgi:hypothetical protein